jgi:hypothetical protein
VLRRFLSPRWLAFHLLVLVLATAFLGLGWWQLRRATGGNVLSWGYMLQWPVFAGFTVFVWYRSLRDTVRPPSDGPTGNGHGNGHQDGSPGGDLPGSGNAEQAAHAAAGRHPAFPVPDLPARPAPAAVPEDEDPELAAYNRYLATLAEADRRL